MPYQRGETWRFQVRDRHAERVYLVRYNEEGMSLWTAMQQVEPTVWEVHVHLAPGRYRFAYFTCEGDAFFNGGTFGLSGQRIGAPDPQVSVTALPRPRLTGSTTAATAPAGDEPRYTLGAPSTPD